MLTKGMIMTVTGALGIIVTLVIFIIMNKNTKKQLNILMCSSISEGKQQINVDDKVNKYIVQNKKYIFENRPTDIHVESTTIDEQETSLIENESTTIDDELTTFA